MSKTFGQLKVGDEAYVIKDNDVKICKVVDCARNTSDAIGFTCIALDNDEYIALPNDSESFGGIYCDIDDAIRKMQEVCATILHDYREASGALNKLETKKKEMIKEEINKTTTCRNLELFGDNTPTKVVTSEDLQSMNNEDLQQMLLNEMVRRQQVTFTCIGKQVTMSVQELIDYYIDTECVNTAEECGNKI